MSKQTAAADVPRHIGFIVDGNRRWAKAHNVPAYEGHLAGYEALKEVVFEAVDAGVEYVSLYAFSTENWKRSESEVGRLMGLTMRAFKRDLKEFIERGIRVRILGTEEGLDEKVVEAGREAEAKTKDLTRGTVCICFNYGGQREIVDAARKIIEQKTDPATLTEENFAQYLYHPEIPLLDILVRTSGEQRLSNFMLWRAAYAELIFLEKNWPDMRPSDVYEIIETYQSRQRRYGS